jgi:hypothetical protein
MKLLPFAFRIIDRLEYELPIYRPWLVYHNAHNWVKGFLVDIHSTQSRPIYCFYGSV